MAKSTPKLGQRSARSHWISRGYVLSDSARQRLATSVGMTAEADADRVEVMCRVVEHHLGAYCGALHVVDNAPRAADYVSEFQALKQHADALARVLGAANPRIMEDLEAELETDHATSLAAVQAAIAALSLGAARRVAVYEAEADRGGRPKLQALGLLIDGLCRAFDSRFTASTQRQPAELAFCRAALDDAGIKIAVPKLRKLLLAHRQGKKPPK